MTGEDHRYAVDIRVFVSVIVIAMAVSFGVGVGLGPTAHSQVAMTALQQLPPVTSVELNAAESALAAQAAADDGELHEPAGQVRKTFEPKCYPGIIIKIVLSSLNGSVSCLSYNNIAMLTLFNSSIFWWTSKASKQTF